MYISLLSTALYGFAFISLALFPIDTRLVQTVLFNVYPRVALVEAVLVWVMLLSNTYD